MSDYVLRAGDTLSGTLETEDKTLEVNFVDGLITFSQQAGVFLHDGDLELSNAGDINLLPASDSQVTIGDTQNGGTFRPVVITDQAYQTRGYGEAFKVCGDLSLGLDWTLFSHLQVNPTNTDDSRRVTTAYMGLYLAGGNKVASNSEVLQAQLTLDGSAAQPAVSDQELAIFDLNVDFGPNFTGSVPRTTGVNIDFSYDASASGTCTDFYGINGHVILNVADKITNFAWLNLPTVSNVTNFYHMILGPGTIQHTGELKIAGSAAGDLVLTPASGSQVTMGDTGAGGTYRPLVIADQAYQSAGRSALKVELAPTMDALVSPIYAGFYPQGTSLDYNFDGLNIFTRFTGSNRVALNSETIQAGVYFDGSAAFPDPGTGHPTGCVDVNVSFDPNYSGTVAQINGITVHPIYQNGASGTVTNYYGICGYDEIAVSGKVTTAAWLYLPTIANATNFYHMILEPGTIQHTGALKVAGSAAGNLTLTPYAGSQVTIGDTGAGGTYRPLVIADQAYQSAGNAALKVEVAPTMDAVISPIYAGFYPQGTSLTYNLDGLNIFTKFTGANRVALNSETIQAGMYFSGSAEFPDPGSGHPTSCVDINVACESTYSGSVARVNCLNLHPIYNASASGTISDFRAINIHNEVSASGKIVNFTAFYSPNIPNVTNFYHMALGTGIVKADGNITWQAGSASVVPLAIRGAASQTGDLFRIQDSTPTTKFVVDASFKVGVGTATPQSALHVYGGNADGTDDLTLESFQPGIKFKDRSSADTQGNFRIYGDAGVLNFAVDAAEDGTFESNALRIWATGNVQICQADDQLGFFGGTPVSQRSAYTQTYSTATRTHNNLTAATGSYGAGAYGYASAAQASAIATNLNAVINDVTNVKRVVNSLIDDLQEYNLVNVSAC